MNIIINVSQMFKHKTQQLFIYLFNNNNKEIILLLIEYKFSAKFRRKTCIFSRLGTLFANIGNLSIFFF